jgi:hypothetical protein
LRRLISPVSSRGLLCSPIPRAPSSTGRRWIEGPQGCHDLSALQRRWVPNPGNLAGQIEAHRGCPSPQPISSTPGRSSQHHHASWWCVGSSNTGSQPTLSLSPHLYVSLFFFWYPLSPEKVTSAEAMSNWHQVRERSGWSRWTKNAGLVLLQTCMLISYRNFVWLLLKSFVWTSWILWFFWRIQQFVQNHSILFLP